MISLILATVGRVSETEQMIRTLSGQTTDDFELVLVDQNQDDRLLPVVARAMDGGMKVQHLRLQPPNLSAARNLGIGKARGSVIGFPDDDCWYEPDTLANIRQALTGDAAPGGVVGCWVEQGAAEAQRPPPGPISVREWERFRGGDASSITLFFRTSVLRGLGGFDPQFGVGRWFGCGEETDLLLRVLRSGVRVERVESIRVHHRFSNTKEPVSGGALMRARGRGRGAGGLYAKHSLPWDIVVRGMVSGFLKPVLKLEGFGSLLLGIAESFGRLEGFVRWKSMRGGGKSEVGLNA